MVKFTERIADAGYVSQCGNCGYPVAVTTYEIRPGEDILLCEVCYSTHLGAASIYGDCACDLPKMFKAMGWIANKILTEIKPKQLDNAIQAAHDEAFAELRKLKPDLLRIAHDGPREQDDDIVTMVACAYCSGVISAADSAES